MELKAALGQAVRYVREQKGLTQEDFSTVSSRTYISRVERAGSSMTVEKLGDVCSVLKVHPLTVLCLAYSLQDQVPAPEALLQLVATELEELARAIEAE